MIGAWFAIAGAVSGYLQVRALRHVVASQTQSMKQGVGDQVSSDSPLTGAFKAILWFWLRLLLVGGVLVLAAIKGHLLPAAVGWTSAYFLSTVLLRRGLK